MINLIDGGAYLVDGVEIVKADAEAAAALSSKTGSAPSAKEASKNTIAYDILSSHNTSGDDDNNLIN